jgi:MinD-like ATPase involved in chromosome partitioning or flagellar assembly
MKVAVINFSGNVGKTTIARQLLGARLDADEFAVETINAGASDESVKTSRIKGKDFGELQEDLMLMKSAIVDVGASNAEDFVKLMAQFSGSHEEFDYFIVPVVSEKKQQADTINTIKTLARLGVPAKKIRVIFNRVDPEDSQNIDSIFAAVVGFHHAEKLFTLNRDAVIFNNEIFDRLRQLKKTVSDIVSDSTDYRSMLREAKSEDDKHFAVSMVSAQRLAKSANENLDQTFKAIFK